MRLASFGSGEERALWGRAEDGRGVWKESGEETIGVPESVVGIIRDPEVVLRMVESAGDIYSMRKS